MIKSFLVLLSTTLVMLTVFAPTAGASDGSRVPLDEKPNLAYKDLNLDKDFNEELIAGRKTEGDSEILLAVKKKETCQEEIGTYLGVLRTPLSARNAGFLFLFTSKVSVNDCLPAF
jgi:hypothetical protein